MDHLPVASGADKANTPRAIKKTPVMRRRDALEYSDIGRQTHKTRLLSPGSGANESTYGKRPRHLSSTGLRRCAEDEAGAARRKSVISLI